MQISFIYGEWFVEEEVRYLEAEIHVRTMRESNGSTEFSIFLECLEISKIRKFRKFENFF